MADTFTAATLAPLLAASAEEAELKRMHNLVRNWAARGILKPLAGSGEGRGVHRRYDRQELLKAAVLLELTRYALPWSVLERVAGAFDEARPLPKPIQQTLSGVALAKYEDRRAQQEEMIEAAAGGKTSYLILNPRPAGDFRVELRSNLKYPGGACSALVVDVTKVLGRFG